MIGRRTGATDGVRRAPTVRWSSFKRETRPMVGLTLGEGGARALSALFYIAAAHVLAPAGFGIVRYTIALALIACAGHAVLVKVLLRELGAARGDERQVAQALGTGLAAAIAILVVAATLSVVLGVTGATGLANVLGLVVVLVGTSAFQVYYGMARGLGEVARPALTYIGASLVQIVVFLVGAALFPLGVTSTLLIFGLTWLAPIAAWELYRPVLLGRRLVVERAVLRAFAAAAAPLIVGQLAFVVWSTADQIWVAGTLGPEETGFYSAAKNLATVFVILPAGVNGVLLPRLAELRKAGEVRRGYTLLFVASVALFAVSGLLALGFALEARPLVTALYGSDYGAAAVPLVPLCIAMTLYAGHFTLTGSAIGLGRSAVSTVALGVTALVEVGMLLLGSGHTTAFAGWASAVSLGVGFVVAIVMLLAPRGMRSLSPEM